MDLTLLGVESGNEKKSEEGGEANRVSTVSQRHFRNIQECLSFLHSVIHGVD